MAISQDVLWTREIPYSTETFVLDVNCVDLTDWLLARLSSENNDRRIELTANGKLVVRPLLPYPDFQYASEISFQISNWAHEKETGMTFSSKVGFRLANGAVYSPTCSWVPNEKWRQWVEEREAKRIENRDFFGNHCPDLVTELCGSWDTLTGLQRKMEDYMENGARLGWLIDPSQRRVYVYRPEQEPEVLDNPEMVSGDPELPGFELNLAEIW